MNLLPRGFAEGEENNTYTSINGKLLHFLSNKRRKEDQECRELAERSDFWGFLVLEKSRICRKTEKTDGTPKNKQNNIFQTMRVRAE